MPAEEVVLSGRSPTSDQVQRKKEKSAKPGKAIFSALAMRERSR